MPLEIDTCNYSGTLYENSYSDQKMKPVPGLKPDGLQVKARFNAESGCWVVQQNKPGAWITIVPGNFYNRAALKTSGLSDQFNSIEATPYHKPENTNNLPTEPGHRGGR